MMQVKWVPLKRNLISGASGNDVGALELLNEKQRQPLLRNVLHLHSKDVFFIYKFSLKFGSVTRKLETRLKATHYVSRNLRFSTSQKEVF